MKKELSYKPAYNNKCDNDSPDPRRHIWETNARPPADAAACLCGRFRWGYIAEVFSDQPVQLGFEEA